MSTPSHTSPEIVALGVSLGWKGIIERRNRDGKLLGFCGLPPNYSGPRINLRQERMRPDYAPASHCVPSTPVTRSLVMHNQHEL